MAIDPYTSAAMVNVVGTGLQAYQGRRNIRLTHKYNRAMADYTFNKNLEMWNLQNQYNSPQAQMQRLQEAGLNPHLMYGKGTVGNAQSMPTYQGIPGDFRGMPSAIGSMAQAGLGTIAQKQDIENKRIQLRAAELGVDAQRLANGLQEIELEYQNWIKSSKKARYGSETTVQFYNEYIKSIEADRYKYGTDGASTEYKILFEYLNQEMINGKITEQQLGNMLRNMALTKIGYGVAKDVFGATLVGKFAGKGSKSGKVSQTVTQKTKGGSVSTTTRFQ